MAYSKGEGKIHMVTLQFTEQNYLKDTFEFLEELTMMPILLIQKERNFFMLIARRRRNFHYIPYLQIEDWLVSL